ncbi:hypothetical protein [Lysinibacillus sp. JNUCC 51]|uniref:hypothetical protein n=1 Tax=Lysinibacillus sp. JNUCC-51 TaxID=2792479 RepID=UPI0019351225|nr:hypothetical protein JNUCC51_18410 [Lysinibacillus sp. JNUCC-51]
MLLKFTYEDFIVARRINNTSKVNVQNYRCSLYLFIGYYLEKGVIKDGEDVTHEIRLIISHV